LTGGSGAAGEQRALDELKAGLDIRPLDTSGLVAVRFSAREARLAADIPNAVAGRYVALLQAAREQADPAGARALAGEIERRRGEAAALDERLAGLRKAQEVQPAQAGAPPAESEAELARLGRERAAAEERAKALRAALANAAALRANPDVQSDEAAAALIEREAQLRDEIDQASATLLGNHPRMRALNAQLAETRGQLAAAARTVLAGIEDDLRSAAAREKQVAARRDAMQTAADAAAARAAEIAALEAKSADAHRQLDASVARQRDAAGMGGEFLPVEARLFRRAEAPAAPASASAGTVGAIAFAVSLALMLAWMVLRARRRRAALPDGPEIIAEVDELEMPVPARQAAEPTLHELIAARARLAESFGQAAPAPAPGREAAPVRRTIGEIDVERAAEKLIAGGAARAVFLSAEGDAGAAASVRVAREVADAGLRVILLDLTASGAASRPMLGAARLPGITDLLVSEAQFGDVIHNDRASACNVVPAGTADPLRAMRAAERLPIILESLASAYDLVVVECGAADGESIRRLVCDDTAVLLSAVEPSDEIAELALDIADRGLGQPIIVAAAGLALPPRPDRSAA
jgi:Mrp family chromosome partitioning ATPase